MISDKKECQTRHYFSLKKMVCIMHIHAFYKFEILISVPPVPTNISVLRLNGTHMNISWSLIPITETRGFIQSYFILYEQNDNRKREISSVPATDSSVVIGGLDPGKAYRVSISASTNAGQGEFTSAVIVDGKVRCYFQHNLVEVLSIQNQRVLCFN